MNGNTQKFTLDQSMAYEIRVPGTITKEWLDWNGGVTITDGMNVEGSPISTIRARVDQAALHGLLQHLYSIGLPVISVVCLEDG